MSGDQGRHPMSDKPIDPWLFDTIQLVRKAVRYQDANMADVIEARLRAQFVASPAPAIPAYPAKHISLKMRRDRKIVLTLELDAVEGAPAYLLTPVNPCVVRAVPAISESEDALLTAARRAIPALAHAAERNPVYQRDYEELSRAIDDAARKGEKS